MRTQRVLILSSKGRYGNVVSIYCPNIPKMQIHQECRVTMER